MAELPSWAIAVGGQNLREDETIAVQPRGVLGVEAHELVEENVGNGSHAPVIGLAGCFLVAARPDEASRGGKLGSTGRGELTWEHRDGPSCC